MARLELCHTGYDDYVEIYVDGRLLDDVFAKMAAQAGEAYRSFDDGLSWCNLNDDFWRTVFDDSCDAVGDHGGRMLFNCGCGVIGCGETYSKVVTTDNAITWADFDRTPVPMPALPGITFDRAQYFAEVRRMTASFPPEMFR